VGVTKETALQQKLFPNLKLVTERLSKGRFSHFLPETPAGRLGLVAFWAFFGQNGKQHRRSVTGSVWKHMRLGQKPARLLDNSENELQLISWFLAKAKSMYLIISKCLFTNSFIYFFTQNAL
jgi:hypothetical protein